MLPFIPGIVAFGDGTVLQGKSMSVTGTICGELVFNTGQSGYQEVLTDPSYSNQIVLFTQPHIGNVGVNADDMESSTIQVNGLIARSISKVASNWRSQYNLLEFLQSQKVIALSEIDTRALTHKLREHGNQSVCLMAGDVDQTTAITKAKQFFYAQQSNFLKKVSTPEPYHIKSQVAHHHVVVCDFGVKKSILKNLEKRHCSLTVIPAHATVADILAYQPDGILLSNGPGDPQAATHAIKVIKSLLETGVPIMGICFGHQLLALASGADTKKMLYGHHGINHPVLDVCSGRVAISSQNHGYVVDEKTLPHYLQITHRSLFDQTIAGLEHTDVPAFGFQGHPEASPGPTELEILFDKFIMMMKNRYAQKKSH